MLGVHTRVRRRTQQPRALRGVAPLRGDQRRARRAARLARAVPRHGRVPLAVPHPRRVPQHARRCGAILRRDGHGRRRVQQHGRERQREHRRHPRWVHRGGVRRAGAGIGGGQRRGGPPAANLARGRGVYRGLRALPPAAHRALAGLLGRGFPPRAHGCLGRGAALAGGGGGPHLPPAVRDALRRLREPRAGTALGRDVARQLPRGPPEPDARLSVARRGRVPRAPDPTRGIRLLAPLPRRRRRRDIPPLRSRPRVRRIRSRPHPRPPPRRGRGDRAFHDPTPPPAPRPLRQPRALLPRLHRRDSPQPRRVSLGPADPRSRVLHGPGHANARGGRPVLHPRGTPERERVSADRRARAARRPAPPPAACVDDGVHLHAPRAPGAARRRRRPPG
mmetsp:Transcript_51965/g.123694  ORF Transcript_51965/g.123694 Transcript_51965/m.123694 type:complete len:392 (-) Transcript_51965:837-2012(-)